MSSTKRAVQEALVKCYALGDGQFRVVVWQEVGPDAKRTAAKVATTWRGITYTAVGFATLNKKSGDVWDPTYGAEMAIRKAISNLAKQIACGKPPALVRVWSVVNTVAASSSGR